MSIWTMASNSATEFKPGTYCPLEWNKGARKGDSVVVMEESYVGCVLYLGEHNYYDDSDFYAIVWDEEDACVREVTYATTRGWSYPNHAEPDASDEIWAKHNAFKRHERAVAIVKARAADAALAAEAGITRRQLRKLRGAVGSETLVHVLALLKTKKFRSAFRESLAAKIREWILDPAPAYKTPLSPAQMRCLHRQY